ncbi:hypothetical protein M9Y10_032381 [Tritrichomonas musculus]|uniref:Uncharacterized protein n=1 Tax=Tritrichomonas musculus TaxID=1915356 RepID=A0ABR2GZW7_9EUKA
MSLKKQCEEVLKNVDHSSLGSVQNGIKQIQNLMSQYGSDPYIGTAISKLSQLKDEVGPLEEKQKEENKKNEENNENLPNEENQKEENQQESIDKKEDNKNEANNQTNQQTQQSQQNQNVSQEQSNQPEQASKCCILI